MLKATLLRAGESRALQRQMERNRLARAVAGRFIAGGTLEDAERVVSGLNARGVTVALDHLGENTRSAAHARSAAAAYLAALDRIHETGMDANISVKLTALGLDIGRDLALEEATRVAARGKEVGAMVGVDMEAHPYVERTLEAVEALKDTWDRVGVCLQAYLYRTRDDLDRMNRAGVPARLAKGAYREPADVAYQRKASVDDAYARLLEALLRGNPYPMVATHDPALVRLTKTLAGRYRRDRDSFEFQMLYGVRRDLQDQVVAEGYRLRVYVPYGDQWYPYFMRRLAERPANVWFFVSNLVKR